GFANGWLLWAYERLLRRVVADTDLDLLHFSLHPLSAGRVAVEFALVLLHASVIWGAAAINRLPATLWRRPRTTQWRATAAGAWLAGAIAATLVARAVAAPVPVAPMWVAVLLAGATEAKERLVAETFGPQAISLREDLQRRLQQAVNQIDQIRGLDELVRPDGGTPSTNRAFAVWSRTDLATYRLTSAVELYGADGTLLSPFALSLPEYSTAPYRPAGCTWEQPIDEVSPFGSSERHVLRTGRGVCVRGRIAGGIVVRVM